jgi:hypothetical protein
MVKEFNFKETMMTNFKKLALGAALLTASAASYADLPFTVDNSQGVADTGAASTTFVADKITGDYNEIVVVNNAAGQFSATIVLSYTNFSGTVFGTDTGLNINAGYGLYSVINIDGNVISNDGTTVTTGNWTGDFNLFLDVERDTNSFAETAIAGIGATSFSAAELDDDVELLSGLIGTGGSVGNATAGGFSLYSDNFSLSSAGEAFFIEPDPFYSMLISDGDLEDFFSQISFGPDAIGDIQTFDGEASVVFNVPEPSAIALIGLGLFALGFRARK